MTTDKTPMQIALMIPLTEETARCAASLWPKDWPEAQASRIDWPEMDRGVPQLPETIAAALQESIESDLRFGFDRMIVVTRSEIAVLRVQRMIAEGAAITAAIYLVDDAGQERVRISPEGYPEQRLHVFLAAVREAGEVVRRSLDRDKAAKDAAEMVRAAR